MIMVSVVYALPNKQYFYRIKIPKGSSVRDTIIKSGLLKLRKEINLDRNKIGIFSQQVQLDDKVRVGDRIEIYRPLTVDPKELRRQRVKR